MPSSTAVVKEIVWDTTAEDIIKFYKTDLTGKVAIVTGANSGVGQESARVLALAGAKVIIPCRTLGKSNGATEEIKKTVLNADLVPMQLDLSDLSSIKAFATAFLDLSLSLDILMNNASIMNCPRSSTKDGFETQFGVNHLGHFYLIQLLTDKIKASAPSCIAVVSSSANSQTLGKHGIDFDNLNAEKCYSPATAYGQSKLANIYHARKRQRRFDAEGVNVLVTVFHPGNVSSNLTRHTSFPIVMDAICSMRNYETSIQESRTRKQVKAGASTNIYCAVSPDAVKGEFYTNNAINTDLLNKQANNQELARKSWDTSEKLLAEKTKQTLSLLL